MFVDYPFRMADQPKEARDGKARADALYRELAEAFGAAIQRFARGYEADEGRRQDLVQEIHVGLWRRLAGYDGRCSPRTWRLAAHKPSSDHDYSETIEELSARLA